MWCSVLRRRNLEAADIGYPVRLFEFQGNVRTKNAAVAAIKEVIGLHMNSAARILLDAVRRDYAFRTSRASLVPMLSDPAASGKEFVYTVVTRGSLTAKRFVRSVRFFQEYSEEALR